MKLGCAAASPMRVFRAAAYRDELEAALGRVDELARRHDVLASELASVRVLSRTTNASPVGVPSPLHRLALTSRATFAVTMVGDVILLAFLCCATREPFEACTVFAFGWCARLPGVALLLIDLALTVGARAPSVPSPWAGDGGHAGSGRIEGGASLLEQPIGDRRSEDATSLPEQTTNDTKYEAEGSRGIAFGRSVVAELLAETSERRSDTDIELAGQEEPGEKGALGWPCE